MRERPIALLARGFVVALVLASVSAAACGGSDGGSAATTTTTTTTTTTAAERRGDGGSGPSGGYESAITEEEVDGPAFEALERDITRRVEAAGLPGASLLVLHEGELVEQEAFGSYDLSTRVPIASASKWLTGATIMTLVDDGLIDLDAPIRTYLPGASGPPGTITMRQLVAFTSGLEYDERIPCFGDRAMTLAECNAEVLALPLLGAPGTGYRYTGTHLHVAAGVVESVTGQTWEEVFQDRIAEPLGMTETTFVDERRAATAADGHPNPAGGAVSTLGDYGRFLEVLVHDGVAPSGERILSPEAMAEMATDQTGDARFVSAARPRRTAGTEYGVAHWLDVVRPDGTALVESSPGAFGFRPWIDHVNDVAGVYLVVDRDEDRRVQASGGFLLEAVAQAVGGELPTG